MPGRSLISTIGKLKEEILNLPDLEAPSHAMGLTLKRCHLLALRLLQEEKLGIPIGRSGAILPAWDLPRSAQWRY
jgi:hypothetical protein